MDKINENKMPVEEKESQPQVIGPPGVGRPRITYRTRVTYTLRWQVVALFVFMVAVELYAAWIIYRDWNKTFETISTTNNVKGRVRVLDVNRLRFDLYVRDFGKNYDNEEYKRRFQNFKVSLKEIARLNQLENNTVFGLTKFSDMSKEEFAERILSKSNPFSSSQCYDMKKDCTNGFTTYLPSPWAYSGWFQIPRSFDWRKKGVVKPVLNQRLCQGCWAFSTIGVAESMAAIELGDHESRSIQELLDCSTDTAGCNRGNVVLAMNFLCDRNVTIFTEKEYPMDLGIDKHCRGPKPGYNFREIKVKEFSHFCDLDEDIMVDLIANHGPLIVSVDARNWQYYTGGIITRACTLGQYNHVVQIVGYEGYDSPDTPIPYYIVKNSCGEDFGDHGYVKIAMKHGDISNVCGIAGRVTIMNVMYTN